MVFSQLTGNGKGKEIQSNWISCHKYDNDKISSCMLCSLNSNFTNTEISEKEFNLRASQFSNIFLDFLGKQTNRETTKSENWLPEEESEALSPVFRFERVEGVMEIAEKSRRTALNKKKRMMPPPHLCEPYGQSWDKEPRTPSRKSPLDWTLRSVRFRPTDSSS